MQTEPADEPSLPPCVTRVLMHIGWLDDAARAPFPNLDVSPSSPDDARRLIRDTTAWGAEIYDACAQQSDLNGNRVTKDGESLLLGLFETRMSRGSLDFPLNVMGEPPACLREACQAGALTGLGPGGVNDIASGGRDLIGDWPAIAARLKQAHAVILVHAADVVRWARSKAASLSAAHAGAPPADASSPGTTLARNGRHPLHAEILHFVEEMYRPFHLEKIDKWIVVGTSKQFRVTDYYGREFTFSGIGFDGTPRAVFWGGFVEPFLKDMIQRGVEHAVRLADDRGFERSDALRAARGILRSMVTWAYHAMDEVEINHLRRDRQTIHSRKLPPIQRTDSRPMVDHMQAFIDDLLAARPEKRTRAAREALRAASRPTRDEWASHHAGGEPLRGWHDIGVALGMKPSDVRKRVRFLRRQNAATHGPIRTIRKRPQVDRGELRAWFSDSQGQYEAMIERDDMEVASAQEPGERGGVHAADLKMRVVKAPRGGPTHLAKPRKRPGGDG